MQRQAYTHVMPRTLNYRTDGSGRDTYISVNNGGYCNSFSKTAAYKVPNGLIRPRSATSKPSAKSLHYKSDGTGRDGYITFGDGGLHTTVTPRHFNATFQQSLRSHAPLNRTRKNDAYSWAQLTWKTSKSRSSSRIKSKRVNECVNRLYQTSFKIKS